jgi:hypothetical protein
LLLGVLIVGLAAPTSLGCGGGQTGQPAADRCDPTALLAADDTWHGTTPRELARAFEGTHSADLVWYAEPFGAATTTPVDFPDVIAIEVSYGGDDATQTCSDLAIPVSLRISTSASGIDETQVTDISISDRDVSGAAFSFRGAQADVVGELGRAAYASGRIVPHGTGAPGGWATFPPAATGGNGG